MLYNTRSILNINENLNQIGNKDESAIYYENIYPTTIDKIGEKSVNVRYFGKDKMRIKADSTIFADGTKLPLL